VRLGGGARLGGAVILIRLSSDGDVEALHAVYAHNVLTGTATFELEPPDVGEMARRRAAVLEHGLPYLVAELDGRIVGYAYASPFRPRPGYRFTVEDSVYVAPGTQGRGIGKALLADLIGRCEALGLRRMLAVIGDSANAASIGMHRSCGFEPAGVLPATGWKFGRWLDVVLMQRPLGDGAETAPE
jgi:L-amino acid N-acyltransferase YncA